MILRITFLVFVIILISCNNTDDKKTEDKKVQQPAIIAERLKDVEKNPDSVNARMRLINTLDSLQLYEQAIAQADSLLKRDSLNNSYWMTKGQLQESNKDTLGAIVSYERALRIYPSVDAQLYLANLYAETKNKNALLISNNVLRMGLGRETDANAYFVEGIFYARTGDSKNAISSFDRAINNNYTLMEAYMEKGFVYYDSKKYNDALKTFETAITINNTYADAYYWKAKTYEAIGNKTEALINYERSLGLDKQLNEARAAIKRLQG